MKAARWIGMGRVVCEDAPVPSVADGEILVRTAYASICGSDLHVVFLNAPPRPGPAGYPGHESAGEVVESRCPGFEPGDCVLTVPHAAAGRCLAEFQALPGSACIRLPAAARLNHLLMAQQLGTVVYALRCNPLDLIGKDAVVIGQGSAGAFFTFLLKRAGAARVLVSDKSPALVEAVGSRETFPLSLELAAAGATVVWFGLPEGAGDYMFSFSEFFRRRLTAYSTFGAQGEPGLESFRYAVRMIADGAIDVAPLLSHMLPIEEVDEAFRVAHERTDNALKVSIKF